ncbi:MotE family protein [Aneurinibacillus tyrosinisolvens]|uniref:MotE family protein n=1 Tax=Aneurinibacillus tyrosinisolvens TaxID=1443435 RepID=UPI00069CA801|nr:MotE family protein [Aneurinibacillus tyrosinisolvens]
MEEMGEEQSYSKLEWFFYIVFIPLLFTVVLAGIIAQMFGYNVVGVLAKGLNQIPVVEKVIPDSIAPAPPTATEGKKTSGTNDNTTGELRAQILSKDKEIAAIKEASNNDKQTIRQLEQQIASLKQASAAGSEAAAADRKKQIQDVAKTYTSMSAGKAAPIIEKLTLQEASYVMLAMKPEERAAIFAKMDPQKAADLSILLKDMTLSKDADIASMQKRIQALVASLGNAKKK